MMKNTDAVELLKKYRTGKCTEKEKALLETWYLQEATKSEMDFPVDALERLLDEVWESLPIHQPVKTNVRPLYIMRAVAASVLLLLSVGVYFFLKPQQKQQIARHDQVVPGGNKAILTLANGQKIILTDAKNGAVARQGNIVVNKTAGGQVTYQVSNSTKSGQEVYNTMTTPRGGTWGLTLSDGTRVWLNSVSSIKYPTAFTGKERNVEITGEAYFEVAHNRTQPFHVTAGGQRVEVLGTHFNINAYPEEDAVKTTLLQGSVKLVKSSGTTMESVILKPGQQAQVAAQIKVIKHADTDQVMAWKNGLFSFEKVSLQEVLRQLSRWYDVEVVYKGNIEPRKFGGEIGRDLNLSEVLDGLKASGVHFSLQGRRLIVMQ
jgi:ferric-dicitrate binding protein FerR (iron transport regulator)